MTSRERLLTAIRGGKPDRVPCGPFGLGRLDHEGSVAAELIRRSDPFIPIGSGADPFVSGAAPATGRAEGNDAVMEIPLPGGNLIRRIRTAGTEKATVEFPFKTYDDAERYLAAPYTTPEPDLAEYRKWRERVGEDGLVLVGVDDGITVPASWFSPEDFCLAWAEERDLVGRLAAAGAERVLAYVEKLCRAGVDAFRIVGGEYASVELGPDGFRKLVVANDRPLVETIHRHGAIAYFHNHGPMQRYFRDLLAIGIDALDPLEAPPWGDVADLGAARKAMDGRVCLVGNLDDMEVVNKLPIDEVRNIARERLAQAGDTGFVLGGTASGSYGEAGARGFMAMVEVVEGR